MKTKVTEKKTKGYLFRTTSRYPDPFVSPYGEFNDSKPVKKAKHYSYIVEWQMENDVILNQY